MVYLFLQTLHIGYLRDTKDKEHLIIDEEASVIIRRIYKEYLEGVNCHKIAEKLNDDLIPTRIEHMKKVGVNIGKSKKPRIIQYKIENGDTLKSISKRYRVFPIEIMKLNNIIEYIDIDKDEKEKAIAIEEQQLIEGHILKVPKRIIWDDGMIREILRNEMYTGYIALGKTENKSYKDRTKIRLPKEQWIRVPNCHEPIIDREVWLQVKEKLKKNTHNVRTTPKNLFAKKLYCSCCGRAMQKSKIINKENDDYYISCKTVNKAGNFCDNRKVIRKKELEKVILDKINEQLSKYYDKQNIEDKYNELLYSDINKKVEKLKLQFNNLEYSLSEKTNRLNLLYEDRMNNIISLEEFKILKNNVDNEIIKLNSERNIVNSQIEELEKQISNNKTEKNDLFEKYKQIDTLTPEILNEFIDKIYMGTYNAVTNSRNIKIIWNIDKKEEIV